MLIGLVRDSVLQCFCHTCRVPTLPAGNLRTIPAQKLRTNQPKSSNRSNLISTEIRCQEKSKGGLSYEVILGQPAIIAPPIQQKNPPCVKDFSVEEIERKLREAEERRLSIEKKKTAHWSVKQNKIVEASRKKNEMNKRFSNSARETLDVKMGIYEGNREALMTDLKEKLKAQFNEIERNRITMEQQRELDRLALDKKLSSAANMREENIKKMLERLKEHNQLAIRASLSARENEKAMEKLYVFENKLFMAERNREKEIQKKLNTLRIHDQHAEMVRQKAASQKFEQSEPMVDACG